ncbi:copper amine oxidase N-terminal domain-containing protein [Paenibacillus campi]|uniref:copper amine oxidase N-terminal domain-containing protein n=1 Tax=Paenibacillus campi TaxID=3106031 RepID=UPI002AFEB0B4|nr:MULTISPECIES: copper amine oxidase N-terminal domain-containing protein [unclassified Paenibacillus]
MNRWKLTYATLLLLTWLVIQAHPAYASSLDQPEVYVNNEKVDMYAVVSTAGITYVPFRPVFEKLDMTVDWNNTRKSVTATNGKTTIMLTNLSDQAYVNGQAVQLLEPPMYDPYDGIFYVNLRFVAEASGAQVTWITKDHVARIYIKTPA